MSNKNTKTKVSDMTPEQKKEYVKKKSEFRKTNDFFTHEATHRTNKVLKAVAHLKHMSKYNSRDEQVKKLLDAIDKAVDELHRSFEGSVSDNTIQL